MTMILGLFQPKVVPPIIATNASTFTLTQSTTSYTRRATFESFLLAFALLFLLNLFYFTRQMGQFKLSTCTTHNNIHRCRQHNRQYRDRILFFAHRCSCRHSNDDIIIYIDDGKIYQQQMEYHHQIIMMIKVERSLVYKKFF